MCLSPLHKKNKLNGRKKKVFVSILSWKWIRNKMVSSMKISFKIGTLAWFELYQQL